MIDYTACILFLHPNAVFSTEGWEYEGIRWHASSPVPQPSKATLDAAWPQVLAKEVADAQAAQVAAANEQTIGQMVDAALAGNAAYIALTSRTQAQVAAQVLALTRQNNGIIRLLRRKLDATT